MVQTQAAPGLPSQILPMIFRSLGRPDQIRFTMTCRNLSGLFYLEHLEQSARGNCAAFFWACYSGDTRTAKLMLDLGVAVNSRPISYQNQKETILSLKLRNIRLASLTPLDIAICLQHTDLVNLLISHGADVNRKPSKRDNQLQCPLVELYHPIHWAVKAYGLANYHTSPVAIQDALQIIAILLDHGADPNPPSDPHRIVSTPLEIAIQGHQPGCPSPLDAMRLLLRKGADVESIDVKIQQLIGTPFEFAPWSDESYATRIDMARLLLLHGGKRTTTIDGQSVLHWLVSFSDVRLEKLLVCCVRQLCICPDIIDDNGNTPLAVACKMVCSLGNKKYPSSDDDYSPSIMPPKPVLTQLTQLLSLDANPNGLCQGLGSVKRINPLHYFMQHARSMDVAVEGAKILLRHGASPRVRPYANALPTLHYAARSAQPKLVKALFRAPLRPDVYETNIFGATALHAIFARISRSSADNILYYRQFNNDDFEVMRILVENGSDIRAKDINGRTPLDYARFANVGRNNFDEAISYFESIEKIEEVG
ncbi:ankyrin repeat-containing domain protein [Whalleya microplaca]|nr:ankyrin repeat-containing domain protein [Whalleya microplaca]